MVPATVTNVGSRERPALEHQRSVWSGSRSPAKASLSTVFEEPDVMAQAVPAGLPGVTLDKRAPVSYRCTI